MYFKTLHFSISLQYAEDINIKIIKIKYYLPICWEKYLWTNKIKIKAAKYYLHRA